MTTSVMQRTIRRTFIPGCLLLILCCLQTEVKAQTPYGINFPYTYSRIDAQYSIGNIPTPPYFAIHPPVYYSYPVARPYGYSPYAYPGYFKTPHVQKRVMPKKIMNPFVRPKQIGKKTARVNAPVIIKNRFFEQQAVTGQIAADH